MFKPNSVKNKWSWRELAIGDSVFIDLTDSKTEHRIRTSAAVFGGYNKMKFTCKKGVFDGVEGILVERTS